MVVYKFYPRDAEKGDIFLGALPERRKNPRRVTEESTQESIINWGRTYFGKYAKDGDIFFIKIALEESERRWTNISPP